jgi:RNA recognition motif-containing protein
MTPWLFVDGFSAAVTKEQLREVFARAGNVNRVLIVQGSRGRVGFVEMASDSEAKQAVRTLGGVELFGQPLRVIWVGHRQPPLPTASL